MAYPGQTITNPVTGEKITFVKTTTDTRGEILIFDCRVTPGGARLPAHVHSSQEERFSIVSGTLGVMIGGKKQELRAGDRAVLPARIKHQWWNTGHDEVHFQVEVAPARNLEAVLEAVCGMGKDGKLNKNAMPRNPFLLAQLGRLSESYLPIIPIWMQKPMLAIGSALGWILGYDPRFSQYMQATSQSALLEGEAA
jgi:mannose-6-phosphate isomerase-like protein (cupin superfamily)